MGYAVTGGTATGGDYTLAAARSPSIRATPPRTSRLLWWTTLLDEADETIVVTLSSPSNATLGANTAHTYTINDNDATPTVAFGIASSSGAESVTPANLAVSLSAQSGQTVTVAYAVTGGTATIGVDYTLAAGTLTFNPGDTAENISIAVVDDLLDEADETIVVTLFSPSNATLGTNMAHTYTINDNDAAPTVAFNAASSNGAEGITPVLT